MRRRIGVGQEVSAKKGDLISHHSLVLRAIVDVEVINVGVGAQLSKPGAARGGDCRTRWGHSVGLPDADKPWALQSGGVPARTKGATE